MKESAEIMFTQAGKNNLKKLILYSIVFWAIWGSFIGLLNYYSQHSLGYKIKFIPTVIGNLLGWSFWGIVTPLIILLQRKFRFQKEKIVLPIFFHTAISLLFGFGRELYFGFFRSVAAIGFAEEPFEDVLKWFLQPERILMNGAFAAIIYWIVLSGAYLYEYYQDSMAKKIQNIKLEQQLSKAKLTALQYQLQPHFLFNTFHSISSLIAQNQNQTAISMITELSDLLRHSLKNGDAYEIRLHEELELINKYLEIIKIRFSNKIKILQSIDDQTKEAFIPSFILQPLLENAVFHGVEQRDSDGIISIESKKREDKLLIIIQDNGVGFDTDSHYTHKTSVGLTNTTERLETLYGNNYQFQIDSKQGEGTRVELSIPFHTQPISLTNDDR